MCHEENINYLRGVTVKDIYEHNYNECVMLLKDDNKLKVNIAGHELYALVDTGSTISTINVTLYNRLQKNANITERHNERQCVLANGAKVYLKKTVTVPIRLGRLTITATLYVLDVKHIDMIIGCDLLRILRAKIDFKTKQFSHDYYVPNNSLSNASTEMLGVLTQDNVNNSMYNNNGSNSVENIYELHERVKDIHIADSDTNDYQKEQLIQLANKYKLCFANNLMQLGRTNVMEYDIEIEDNCKPVNIKPYKCAYAHRQVIVDEIKKLREADLIRPAVNSRWGTPTLLVSKPRSNKLRLVQDCRLINKLTLTQSYPMLDINFLLADIGRNKCRYFSVIDLSNSYKQLKLSRRSQEICVMNTICGSFYPTTCVFGLKNLPSVFTKLMNTIFCDIKDKFMAFFQDDIIIYSSTFEQHLSHIEQVFHRLQNANLTANPTKTFLCKRSITYLGHTITKEGISTTEDNIKKVRDFPRPASQKQCRSLLGLFNFYKRHVKNYGIIAKPLYELTKKQTGAFTWNDAAEEAFQTLKSCLISAPILAYLDMNSDQPLILHVDSSSYGIGHVLSQRQMSDVTNKLIERPISYGSTFLRGNQRKMGSSDLELTGVVYAISKLDAWLRGKKFILVTDHKSLTFMINKNLDTMKPAIARKIIYLQQYDFDIVFKDSERIQHVDALSRLVCEDNNNEPIEDIEPYICKISALIDNDNRPKNACDVDFEHLNMDEVLRTQKLDKFYRCMYNYLCHDRLPEDCSLAKRIQSQKDDYVVSNKLLYHIWNSKNGLVYKQLCIPVQLRDKVLLALHDLETTGHIGVNKMLTKAQHSMFWHGMYTDIQNYVSSCKLCLESNTGHPPKVALNPVQLPTAPFTQVNIDLLRFHVASRGFHYILVMVDSFSKFVVLKEIRKKDAFTVINCLFKEWILKYGVMTNLLHDNGLEFVNQYSDILYKLTGVKSIRISAYHPSANGLVERANRNVISILRKFVQNEPKKWSIYLPYVAHVINSSVSETTKFSPFNILFGTEMKSVLDFSFPIAPENVPKNSKQAYKYWNDHIGLIRKIAQDNMIVAQDVQKRNYDRHARPNRFRVGDLVYMKIHPTDEFNDPKLRKQYNGPFKIVKFISSTNVMLADENDKELPRSTCINFLKKCNQRNIHSSNIEDSDSDVETDSDSTIINDDAGNILIDNDMTDNVEHVNILQNTNEHNNSNNGSDVISIIHPMHYLNDVFPFSNCDNDEFLESVPHDSYSCKPNVPKIRRQVNKKHCRKHQINMISSENVKIKVITNNDDWLSFQYQFEFPIKQEFVYNNIRYCYNAHSMSDLYIYYVNYILGNRDMLVEIVNNGICDPNICVQIPQHIKDLWDNIDPRIVYAVITKVINHDEKIANKLINTNGLHIIDKYYGNTMFTTLLMLVREQLRIRNRYNVSIDLKSYRNPIPHLYGNTLINVCNSGFLLCSCLGDIPECLPTLISVIFNHDVLVNLKKIFEDV